MKNNIFSINWTNIKSAFISIVLTAVLAIAVYIVGVGDIFTLDAHKMANIGALSVLTGLISLIKSFLTTDNGRFLGLTKVADK